MKVVSAVQVLVPSVLLVQFNGRYKQGGVRKYHLVFLFDY